MRAEHKKKKSLEYKKKHIYLEKGEKHDKNYSSTQNTSEEKYLPSDESNSLLSRTDSYTGSHDAKTQVDVEYSNKRKFSRRKIECNWDRYKEDNLDQIQDDSESSNHLIGMDFPSLLDKATSGSSHFQFKSEKEWENDKADFYSLSIDCLGLALSLQSIPIEQRLEIDKKYSIEGKNCLSTTKKIYQAEKLEINHLSDKQENNNIQHLSQLQKNMPSANVNFPLILHTSDVYENETDNYATSEMLKFQVQNSKHCSVAESEFKLEKHSCDNAPRTKPNVEDNLEVLLGVEKQEINSKRNCNQTGSLNIQDRSSNKMNVQTTKKIQPVSHTTSDTKENLEDWLDSILD